MDNCPAPDTLLKVIHYNCSTGCASLSTVVEKVHWVAPQVLDLVKMATVATVRICTHFC